MCFVSTARCMAYPRLVPLRCDTIARELSLGDGEHKVATGDGMRCRNQRGAKKMPFRTIIRNRYRHYQLQSLLYPNYIPTISPLYPWNIPMNPYQCQKDPESLVFAAVPLAEKHGDIWRPRRPAWRPSPCGARGTKMAKPAWSLAALCVEESGSQRVSPVWDLIQPQHRLEMSSKRAI